MFVTLLYNISQNSIQADKTNFSFNKNRNGENSFVYKHNKKNSKHIFVPPSQTEIIILCNLIMTLQNDTVKTHGPLFNMPSLLFNNSCPSLHLLTLKEVTYIQLSHSLFQTHDNSNIRKTSLRVKTQENKSIQMKPDKSYEKSPQYLHVLITVQTYT